MPAKSEKQRRFLNWKFGHKEVGEEAPLREQGEAAEESSQEGVTADDQGRYPMEVSGGPQVTIEGTKRVIKP